MRTFGGFHTPLKSVRPGSTRAGSASAIASRHIKSQVYESSRGLVLLAVPRRFVGNPVYGEPHDVSTLSVKFFTESLILAQDERWRRA